MSYLSQNSKLANKALSITSTDSKEPNKTTEQDPTDQDPKQDGSSHSSLDLTTIMLISGGGLTFAVSSALLLYCIIKKILRNRMERNLVTTSSVVTASSEVSQITNASQHVSTTVRQTGGNPTSSSVYGSTVHKEESSDLSVSTANTSIMCNTASKPTPDDKSTSPGPAYESEFYKWEHAIGKMTLEPAQKTHAIVFKKDQTFGLLVCDNDYYGTSTETRGRHPLTPMYFDLYAEFKKNADREEVLTNLIDTTYKGIQRHKFVPQNVRSKSKEAEKFKAFIKMQLAKFAHLSSKAQPKPTTPRTFPGSSDNMPFWRAAIVSSHIS